MKKVFKIIGLLLAILVVIIVGAIAYITLALPNVDAPELTIEPTPARLARGEYLANNVMGCLDCHAQRDWSKFTGPTIAASKGGGGEKWLREYGFPGNLIAPNITPHALKDWTDGEIYRAVTSGVRKDGSPLFPIMPYQLYGQLEKEDIYSVIAYIKTLKPVASTTPERELDFPLNIIVHTMPKEGTHDLKPDKSDPLAYGKYMVTASACYECHTKQEKGQYLEAMAFAGGFDFPMETGGIVRSANITPDMETGIGNWTKEQFITTFKKYQDSTFVLPAVAHNAYNTMMPWTYYSGLEEEDLSAMYDYLKSLKPIKNQVVKFTPGS
jgi:hypothetical protein